MTDKPRAFGYWQPVHDSASAQDAVRMAGLPVLVMGANAAVLALISLVQPEPHMTMAAGAGLVAALLVALAFRIRAGHAGWIPLVLLVFAGYLAVNLLGSLVLWNAANASPRTGTQIVVNWIIPAICTLLVMGGARGWHWMKSNAHARSF